MKTTIGIAAAVVALLAVVPFVAPETAVQYAINALQLATLAQGWNIVGGYAG